MDLNILLNRFIYLLHNSNEFLNFWNKDIDDKQSNLLYVDTIRKNINNIELSVTNDVLEVTLHLNNNIIENINNINYIYKTDYLDTDLSIFIDELVKSSLSNNLFSFKLSDYLVENNDFIAYFNLERENSND